MVLKFAINPNKAVEALAYVASVKDCLSQKYIAKIFFFAEKWHLNKFGRPIVADTYVAMPQGPVPSTVRDLILQKWDWTDKPENFDDSIEIINNRGLQCVRARPSATFDRLSETDKSCLRSAIEYCIGLSPDELSNVSHLEQAWEKTDTNKFIDYELFIDEDNDNRDEILLMAREAAVAAVI